MNGWGVNCENFSFQLVRFGESDYSRTEDKLEVDQFYRLFGAIGIDIKKAGVRVGHREVDFALKNRRP